MTKKRLVSTIVGVVIVGLTLVGLPKYIGCKRRDAVFAKQIESIKRDARDQLKIGTTTEALSRFFAERHIPYEIVNSEVFATLETSGCAPLGCGTDRAMISVRVKLDQAGAVAEEPHVVDMFVDCL